jgi:TupA-like ATPgrasp
MAKIAIWHQRLTPTHGRLATLDATMPGLRRFARHLLGERLFEWLWVIARVRSDYIRMHGRAPAILRPRRYTEKMQWRKLFELDPTFVVLSDKLASRDFIAARIGGGHSAPLLWAGSDPADVPYDSIETPYVVKSNHACGHTVVVTDTISHDAADFRLLGRRWLDFCYGTEKSEPGYVHVPRRILVERLLRERNGATPLEHRAFVFSGMVQVIQTSLVTEEGKPRNAGFFTRNWEPLGWRLINPLDGRSIRRPERLNELIAIAERLGVGMSHVRVDFYEHDNEITVGEMTLYSWSGMLPFHPDNADYELGRYWRIRWPALTAIWAVALRRHEIRPPKPLRTGTPGA